MDKFKTFGEMFSAVEPWKQEFSRKRDILHKGYRISGYMQVSRSYPTCEHMPALCVTPTPALCELIAREMLQIDHDSIYFDVIVHDDGRAVVRAKYNLIIGGRVIGEVSASELEQLGAKG